MPTPSTAAALAALASDECWNHNTHYHRLIPRVAPPPYRTVLDVGCGAGLLTRRLAPLAEHVWGIDTSAEMVAQARALAPADGHTYLCGDVLDTELGTGPDSGPDGPFDLVTCFATLHHMELEPGLRRLRALTAPGGTLVVVGLARATARCPCWPPSPGSPRTGGHSGDAATGSRTRPSWTPGRRTAS